MGCDPVNVQLICVVRELEGKLFISIHMITFYTGLTRAPALLGCHGHRNKLSVGTLHSNLQTPCRGCGFCCE